MTSRSTQTRTFYFFIVRNNMRKIEVFLVGNCVRIGEIFDRYFFSWKKLKFSLFFSRLRKIANVFGPFICRAARRSLTLNHIQLVQTHTHTHTHEHTADANENTAYSRCHENSTCDLTFWDPRVLEKNKQGNNNTCCLDSLQRCGLFRDSPGFLNISGEFSNFLPDLRL